MRHHLTSSERRRLKRTGRTTVSASRPMRLTDEILDPTRANLGNLGAAMVAAAKTKEGK